jgi:hypothetical protein
MFFSSVPDPLTNKKAQDQHPKVQTCALQKAFECAHKAPGGEPESDGVQDPKDGMRRVYIAITLLLLLLTVSQVCAAGAQFHGCKGTNL